MKSVDRVKQKCNIFIPRNIFSLFLILSKKKIDDVDDYILINKINNYTSGYTNDIITFLTKKKFKIIYTRKNFELKNTKNLQNRLIDKFKINFFRYLNKISTETLKKKYEEFSAINFNNYKKVNIYYSCNIIYYSNLCKKFQNINLLFLEHGFGNFFVMLKENYVLKNNLKEFIANVIKFVFLKIRGLPLINYSYYFGICGYAFNIKKLEYFNHTIKFLRTYFIKGFNQLLYFYRKDLKELKKVKRNNYIFINIPYHFKEKTYKKYINYIIEDVKFKKNTVLLIKKHPGINKSHILVNNGNKKVNLFLKILKLKKINYYLLNKKKHIPAEIIFKYFNVKEIYSGNSTILFSAFYIFKKKIKINAFFSNSNNKKFKSRIEVSKFSTEFIKKRYINKFANFIDLDLIN